MFQELRIYDYQMYTQHATEKQVKYKNIRYTKFKQLSKMKLLLHLRAYKAQG